MHKVLITSTFTERGKFAGSRDRVEKLIECWSQRSIEVLSAYFVLEGHADTLIIAEGNLEKIYEAVKELEAQGNVTCTINVMFPILHILS